MIICGIDFESTGFPATKCRITEIGALCFNPELPFLGGPNGYSELGRFNSLVYDNSYPSQSDEVIRVTGITDEMLRAPGIPSFVQALNQLCDMWTENQCTPDYFIAHNKSFDETLWKAELERHKDQIDPVLYERLIAIPWLCSIQDINHPEKFKSKKLGHLALDYGCPVDPNNLHRATDDVALMVNMLFRAALQGAFTWAGMVGLSDVPWVIVRAIVPSPFGPKGDGGKGKDKAKECGFGYGKAPGTDGPLIDKAWLKRVRLSELDQEKEKLGYEIKVIEETQSQKEASKKESSQKDAIPF